MWEDFDKGDCYLLFVWKVNQHTAGSEHPVPHLYTYARILLHYTACI